MSHSDCLRGVLALQILLLEPRISSVSFVELLYVVTNNNSQICF